jgi:hypothetical protein
VALLDQRALHRAALAVEEVLAMSARAAATVVPADLPDALASHVRQRLADIPSSN